MHGEVLAISLGRATSGSWQKWKFNLPLGKMKVCLGPCSHRIGVRQNLLQISTPFSCMKTYWVTSLLGSSISLNRKQTIFWRYTLHCDLWLVVAVFHTSQKMIHRAEETCVLSIAEHCQTNSWPAVSDWPWCWNADAGWLCWLLMKMPMSD